MSTPNPKIDVFMAKAKKWQPELARLRAILLDCDLAEEMKWRQPCYTLDTGNVAILYSFKTACGIGFMRGSLVPDPLDILVPPGPNSQASRILKFTSLAEIDANAETIKTYVLNAIEVHKAGLKVDFSQKHNLEFPNELTKILAADPELKAAFEALTPGRQRGYNLYFSGAKQSATRTARIERHRERILDGKGMHDR